MTTLRAIARRTAALTLTLSVFAVGCGSNAAGGGPGDLTLLNASYDPTREFYAAFNAAFARHWEAATGQRVAVRMSHGGSGSQARAVIDGLGADVVTLALGYDVDAIAGHAGLLAPDWQGRLPHNSAPYTSTIAFLVRKGNPKGIRNWDDLARAGVEVITPNPKTSGAARWNYLAMWGYALRRDLGPDAAAVLADPDAAPRAAQAQDAARAFVAAIYRNVPVLDQAARGATNTFIQRGMGDVLINWENEILLGGRTLDADGLEIVVPAVSILAEPVVALVDRNVDRKGTREAAQAYLEFLYSETGQDLAASHYFRPAASTATAEQYRAQFPAVTLFTIAGLFGGWSEANRTHFADGGEFDRLYEAR